MMTDKGSSSSSGGGIGVLGATFIVFLVLKLLGKITWSWWWVTVPLWGGLALVLSLVVLGATMVGLATWIGNRRARRRP